MDTLGLPLAIKVTPADVQDRDGAKMLMPKLRYKLKKIVADGGYAGQLVEWTKTHLKTPLEIIKRSGKSQGFKVLPKRWIVERSFAWLDNNRRFSKDYEEHTATTEAFIQAAFCFFIANRLFKHD